MQTRLNFAVFTLFLWLDMAAVASPPAISNIRAAQRTGTHLVDIYYNVVSGGPCTVYVAVSDNGGTSYGVPVFSLTGAVGPGVSPGNDRHIVWNAGTDWAGQFSSQCKVKIIADDGTAPPAPAGMAYIPAGSFQMGDSLLEGSISELPLHSVYVNAFFMDKNLVSKEQWLEVYAYALGHDYEFGATAAFKDTKHPVHSINWFDAVKWCNARSQKEGLTPCYYTTANQTTVYRSGEVNLANNAVKWAADGYRLPTEAEWEKAARGGLQGKRFPWGDTVTHTQANYVSAAQYAYDVSPTRGIHPTYGIGNYPYTSPAGSFAANGYGLYDMAGNLVQWAWDAYGDTWYGQSVATSDDSHGPTFVSSRVLRGGYWLGGADSLRSANRGNLSPRDANYGIGFRCVMGL